MREPHAFKGECEEEQRERLYDSTHILIGLITGRVFTEKFVVKVSNIKSHVKCYYNKIEERTKNFSE